MVRIERARMSGFGSSVSCEGKEVAVSSARYGAVALQSVSAGHTLTKVLTARMTRSGCCCEEELGQHAARATWAGSGGTYRLGKVHEVPVSGGQSESAMSESGRADGREVGGGAERGRGAHR